MNLLIRSDNKKNQEEIDAALCELAFNLYFVRDDIRMFSLLEQRYMDAVIITIDDHDGTKSSKMKQQIDTFDFNVPVICVSNECMDTQRKRLRQKINHLISGNKNGSHTLS